MFMKFLRQSIICYSNIDKLMTVESLIAWCQFILPLYFWQLLSYYYFNDDLSSRALTHEVLLPFNLFCLHFLFLLVFFPSFLSPQFNRDVWNAVCPENGYLQVLWFWKRLGLRVRRMKLSVLSIEHSYACYRWTPFSGIGASKLYLSLTIITSVCMNWSSWITRWQWIDIHPILKATRGFPQTAEYYKMETDLVSNLRVIFLA